MRQPAQRTNRVTLRRPVPLRQVHLDFHTPGCVRPIAEAFDATAFAATMKSARVESVNVFARCHHGYSYYPTRVGTTHPGLDFDLLGKQVSALHDAGIRAIAYVTIGWDDLAAEAHPDWVVVRKDGTRNARKPFTAPSITGGLSAGDQPPDGGPGAARWSLLDPSTAYGEYVRDQVRELCRAYDVDGFWFDICLAVPNYSTWGMSRMAEAGVEPSDDAAVVGYARNRELEFLSGLAELVENESPGADVFFNGTTDAAMAETVRFSDSPRRREPANVSGPVGLPPLSDRLAAGSNLRASIPGHDRPLPQVVGRFRRHQDRGPARVRGGHDHGRGWRCLHRRPAPSLGSARSGGLPARGPGLRADGEAGAVASRHSIGRGGGDRVGSADGVVRRSARDHTEPRRGGSGPDLPRDGHPVRHRGRGCRPDGLPAGCPSGRPASRRATARVADGARHSRRQPAAQRHGGPGSGRLGPRWNARGASGGRAHHAVLFPSGRVPGGGLGARHGLRLCPLRPRDIGPAGNRGRRAWLSVGVPVRPDVRALLQPRPGAGRQAARRPAGGPRRGLEPRPGRDGRPRDGSPTSRLRCSGRIALTTTGFTERSSDRWSASFCRIR